MARKHRWILAATAALACLLGALPVGAPASTAATSLTPTQRRIADELVSVFENSTTRIRYDYVENLHDGCGLTAGRAGFCSATGDMLLAVQAYVAADPGTPLARYLPVLRARAAARSASTRGLGTAFVRDWRAAAQDTAFRAAQDAIVDRLYFAPAAFLASASHLRTPLATAIFYDTAIQHGTGKDPDGLLTLIARTRARAGGLPGGRIGERRWLATFLRVRRADLKHPHNRDRRADWPESVGRVDALAQLLRDGHTGLTPPVRVDPWGGEPFVLR
jgi:chitosanase